MIAEKKITGTIAYLPKRITRSTIKFNVDCACTLPAGIKKDATIPIMMPIKYFTQSLIKKVYQLEGSLQSIVILWYNFIYE